MRLLFSILGPYKKYALLLFFVMLFAGLFEAIGLGLIIPFMGVLLRESSVAGNSKAISHFNDMLSQYLPADQLLMGICVIIFIVFAAKNTLIYIKSVLTIHFYNSLRQYWSSEIMKTYITAEYDYIISEKRGTLINNLINEPMLASKFMGQVAEYISKAIIALSIYSIMLVANWQATLILSIIVAVLLGLIWKSSTGVSVAIGEKRLKLNQEITTHGEQSLNGIRQVKLFSLDKDVCAEFKSKFVDLKKILVKLGVFRNLPAPLGETLIVLCLVLALLYYEYGTSLSALSVLPMLIFFSTTSQKLYQNIAVLVSGRMWLLSYMPSIRVVNNILNGKDIRTETLSEGTPIDKLHGDILLENISFSHDNSNMLFKDLSLNIPKNKITAIVGKSGSGKSTLVDLLCGLYKRYNGNIMINGNELKELNLSSWRKMIGFVSQDTFLFNTSIKENILIGNSNATEANIAAACSSANAHEFIEKLPDSYDTIIGDRGLKLSGGQRQRITVARAIIRTPDLFIFDEATSSLDTQSEKLIQESIERLRDNRTIIIIAHRLSTIKNADLIYVLDEGSIVESGSYDELMNEQDHFYNMVLQQTK